MLEFLYCLTQFQLFVAHNLVASYMTVNMAISIGINIELPGSASQGTLDSWIPTPHLEPGPNRHAQQIVPLSSIELCVPTVPFAFLASDDLNRPFGDNLLVVIH